MSILFNSTFTSLRWFFEFHLNIIFKICQTCVTDIYDEHKLIAVSLDGFTCSDAVLTTMDAQFTKPNAFTHLLIFFIGFYKFLAIADAIFHCVNTQSVSFNPACSAFHFLNHIHQCIAYNFKVCEQVDPAWGSKIQPDHWTHWLCITIVHITDGRNSAT